jgi:hypothetical protein
VGAGGRQHSQIVIGGPLKEGTQIVAVRLQGPAPVARQERNRCLLIFWKCERSLTVSDHLAGQLDRGHDSCLCQEKPAKTDVTARRLRAGRPDNRE